MLKLVKNLEKDFNLDTKHKSLFLSISVISLILMMAFTTLLWWFVSPRLHELSYFLAKVVLNILRVFYLIVILGTSLILLTSFFERNFLIARFAIRLSINFLFPVSEFLGKILGIGKDKLRESFVSVNNSFAVAQRRSLEPEQVLILLPHCLQHTSCKYRITTDINNCIDCGKCDIMELKRLHKKYGVKISIATGGTLARRIIIENRPKFIIAVACHRDLVDGIKDVFPIPVYGVLNYLPEGPCINTRVIIPYIENFLKTLIKKKEK